MPQPKFNWTDESIDYLRELYADGRYSGAQMAAMIFARFKSAVSRNAVIGKLHRLGLGQTKCERILARRQARIDRGEPAIKRVRVRAERTEHMPRAKTVRRREPFDIDPDMVDLPVDFSPCAVTLLDLGDSHCRWPIGDPQLPDFRFCGARRSGEHPYCGRHCRIAYAGKVSRETHQDWRARQRNRLQAAMSEFKGEAA